MINAPSLAALSRRRLVALMGAATFVPGAALAQETLSGADRSFAALSRRWLDGSLRLSPAQATQTGDHRFDHMIDDVSAQGRANSKRFAQDTLHSLQRIEVGALSRANQVDAALLANELRSEIWQEDVEQAWAEEIERRARRVLADPGGGTDWDVVHERLRRQLRREQ